MAKDGKSGLFDRVRVWHLALAFLAAVVLFALGYQQLADTQHGVVSTFDGTPATDFLDCLHFSFVTVTSLGYGDYRPLGWSRFLSSLEVLVGLLLFGMLVAKLTSARSSYYTRQLYSSDCQQRLDHFEWAIRESRTALTALLNKPQASEIKLAFGRGTRHYGPGKTVSALAQGAARFVAFQTSNSEFFVDVPTVSMEHLLQEFTRVARLLNRLLKQPAFRTFSLGDNSVLITSNEITWSIRKVSRLVMSNTKVVRLRNLAGKADYQAELVQARVKAMREQYKNAPEDTDAA